MENARASPACPAWLARPPLASMGDVSCPPIKLDDGHEIFPVGGYGFSPGTASLVVPGDGHEIPHLSIPVGVVLLGDRAGC